MKYELPLSVKQSLANKSVRLHHYLWHVLRNSWHEFDESERALVEKENKKWVPLRPRMVGEGELNMEAGEAFLFMHREMIKNINHQLHLLGEKPLSGWPSIPGIGDPDYPVPHALPAGVDPEHPKSPEMLAVLKDRERQVRDPSILKQLSLARLGAFVETYIHDYLHMRWADPEPPILAQFPRHEDTNTNPQIHPMFDDPSFDWLGFPYSSHVHTTFWQLHVWVDNCVEDWKKANSVTEIHWQDNWIGDMPAAGHSGHHHFSVMTNKSIMAVNEVLQEQHFDEMFHLFKTICSFSKFTASFDYVNIQQLPVVDLVPHLNRETK